MSFGYSNTQRGIDAQRRSIAANPNHKPKTQEQMHAEALASDVATIRAGGRIDHPVRGAYQDMLTLEGWMHEMGRRSVTTERYASRNEPVPYFTQVKWEAADAYVAKLAAELGIQYPPTGGTQ